MKAVYLVLLTAIVLTLPAGGTAESGTTHTGKGTVLGVDVNGSWILMAEEPYGTHVLFLDHLTDIVDETGGSISAAELNPGDLVREECLLVEGGKGLSKQIRLLLPAWMETASPEL